MYTQTVRGLMMVMLTVLFGAGSLIFATKLSYADVEIIKSEDGWGPPVGQENKFKPNTINVDIFKTITKKDADDIAQRVTDFQTLTLVVHLNSTGGDLDAALQIGQTIRKYDGIVQVPKNSTCYSSCALIYIAGVRRSNLGVIGLHRPYFASAPQSRQHIEREAPLMLQKLKNYVQEMGITDIFYQETVNTEPSAIKLYVGDKIKTIVPELDPTYDEIQISNDARKYGVTTVEMRVRQKEKDNCLKTADPWAVVSQTDGPIVVSVTCDEFKWGLSRRVFEERLHEAEKCKLSEQEKDTLKLVDRKEIRDHPLMLKYEACVRNVMLGR